MGGDGTVGRVATAVAAAGGVLGVLPGGRGNDFCRATGIPLRAVAACEVLTSGLERQIDLGVVSSAAGQACFLGIASVGFDSDVQERVLRSRLPLGPLVYRWAAVRTVAGWQHATYSCTLDGHPLTVRGWAVAVANSGVYGGGMKLAPDADLADGRLDVVWSATTGRLRFLRMLAKVFRGTHVEEPSVSLRQAQVVELAADRPFRVFADGDPVGALPATVTVRPGAVRVLLPVGLA
jgi:YegS/Rv2252/BmrU family lipid kinase